MDALYRALVAVAETKGWHIARGARESAAPDRSGRYVPGAPEQWEGNGA